MTASSSVSPRRKRICYEAVTLIFCLSLICGACAQDAARAFLKGPYLQAPGADTMTIMWESPTNRPGVVRYGLKGRLDQQFRLESPRALNAVWLTSVTNVAANGKTNVTEVSHTNIVFLYEMTLTHLRPSSIYTYSAETDGAHTPPKHFKTFGAHPDKVTFVVYGDTRTNPKTHAAIAANFKRHSPDFILHTGDLVAAGKRYDLWSREFFGPLANVIDEIPILPSIGNHEQDGINYLHYLRLPGKELWYSYDVGPVHVLALDFRSEKATDEQFAFARKDLLAATAPWKIVFLHYPVFNIGGHGTRWGHAAYLPLFYQAKVDLVLAGHSHIYERFRPVAPAAETNAWPITHITTGGGGAPLYVTYPHPALAAQVPTNHFVVIQATPTTLKGQALTTNETVIDRFELRKVDGRLTKKYLAQVYPEETLELSFDAAAALTGAVTGAPTTNSAARVMFTIPPFKRGKEPVDLEISLTKSSAPYYEIEGGPFHVAAPSATSSNKVVWATVRAVGSKKIEAVGSTKSLSPSLIFQARVTAGSEETVAYGQKCSVSNTALEAAKKQTAPQP